METIVESQNDTIMDSPNIKPNVSKKRRPKKKKEKDPNKPKRPPSAYVLWMKANRDQIKADNPGISFTDVATKAGQLWKEVKDRTEWETQATKLKEEYLEAMATFKAGNIEKSTSEKVDNSKTVVNSEVATSIEDSTAEVDNDSPKKLVKGHKKRKKKKIY